MIAGEPVSASPTQHHHADETRPHSPIPARCKRRDRLSIHPHEYHQPVDLGDSGGGPDHVEDDPAPIHLQAWGGGNTASRAFHKLKRNHRADFERALSKVVMYNIWYQDDAGNYIETHHPRVTMIYCGHFAGTWNYHSQPRTHDFIKHHVKTNHGPLGALYPQTYVSEGGSPAFFYVVDNGLRNHEHPGFGGWGGRFKKADSFARSLSGISLMNSESCFPSVLVLPDRS